MKLCSRCKEKEAPIGQRWCSRCRAAGNREAEEAKLSQAHGKGFGEGADAMRQTLAMEFDRLGIMQVWCHEVSAVIRRAPRPQRQVQLNGS
jgi:hypothetical protein